MRESVKTREKRSVREMLITRVSEQELAFLAGAGAEKITKFRVRLHYKGRRIK